jgi:ABC-type Na+ transport system ATPase subunit NatA
MFLSPFLHRKTTTISMLTGMIAPTEGYAVIAGKDIRSQMGQIRQDIGICLQHDCLFPNLTVQEHLEFFNRLKGLYSKYSKEEVNAMIKTSIEDVALLEKRNTLSKNLSGGMKRKLSVAIAFCGESKTVLLDEPTSGMDPFSRRFTWNVIRQYRQDRCIILTTHFMVRSVVLGILKCLLVATMFWFSPLIYLFSVGRSRYPWRSYCDHGSWSAEMCRKLTFPEEALRRGLPIDY